VNSPRLLLNFTLERVTAAFSTPVLYVHLDVL
jgi:hypothetical protein